MHQKTAAILTFTDVRSEDKNALATLSATIKVLSLSSTSADNRRTTMTSSFRSTLVTGVEESLGKRVWMVKQRRPRPPRWLSRFRKYCSGASTSKRKLLHLHPVFPVAKV